MSANASAPEDQGSLATYARAGAALPSTAQAVVIGGGLAGLTAAYELTKNGVIPVVLEASDRVGGFLAPLEITDASGTDYAFDAGAESFSTRSTAVTELVSELGLDTVSPSGATAWCFPALGEPFPLPAAGVLGIPSDWNAKDLERALGREGVERARADEWLNTGVGDRSNLAAFVATRMGAEVVDRLVRPIAGGVHSTDPEKLDCTVIHPNFWEIFEQAGSLSGAVAQIRAAAPAGSAVRGIKGGLHRIPSTLRDRIVAGGGLVSTRTAATSLEHTPAGWQVTVTSPAGESSEIVADQVVLAAPADKALGLLRTAGIVSEQEAETAPRGTDISLVTLVVDCFELVDSPPRGSGALIAPGGDVSAKGTTHANVKWEWVTEQITETGRENKFGDGPNVIRFSYGRHGDTDVFTDQQLADMAATDFEKVYGPINHNDFTILQTHVVRWPNALAPVTPALKDLSSRVRARVDATNGIAVTGAWVSGTGLAAVIPHARNSTREMVSKFRKLQ